MKTYFNYDNVVINIMKKQLNIIPDHGPSDIYIENLAKEPNIKRQLTKLTNDQYVKILEDYGAWKNIELEDYEENKLRLLWIAVFDLKEQL